MLPTGLSPAGNPLNNLYSGLGSLGPTYSSQQLFGGVPSLSGPSRSTSVSPTLQTSILSTGLGYSGGGLGINDYSLAPRSYSTGVSTRSNSISTSSLINSFSGLTRGPAASDFNTYGLLDVPAPARRITSIRQIGGQSLGDMLMGRDLEAARETVRHSTSMIESFNVQMAVTAGGWLKSAFDAIGPASPPSYERHYSDGSRDFYLGGEPDTGALLNQGLALLPFAVPKGPKATSSPRPSFYNVADDGLELTTQSRGTWTNTVVDTGYHSGAVGTGVVDTGFFPRVSPTSGSTWQAGRYAKSKGWAAQRGGYWLAQAEGKDVFPTQRNSGLQSATLAQEQLEFFRRGLATGKDPGFLRGQAAQAGYTRYTTAEGDWLASQGAENRLQQAMQGATKAGSH